MKMKWRLKMLLGVVASFFLILPMTTDAAEEKIAIDANNFPDKNFRNYVLEEFDTNGDKKLDQDEIDVADGIYVSDSSVKSLEGIKYFTSLVDLECDANGLTKLPELPDGVVWLSCFDNELTALPKLPDGLEYLDCSENKLTKLPELPSGLTDLSCDTNKLTVLPKLPEALVELSCGTNKLTKLPELPSGLEELWCYENELTEIPELPDDLVYFGCGDNNLKKLPELPSGIIDFSCYANELTELPKLPDALVDFLCWGNNLTELPELPDNLRMFYCNENNLTEIPELPDGIEEFVCDRNKLTQLPELPDELEIFSCDENRLKNLPKLPEGLKELWCNENKLKELPDLPSGLIELWCEDNMLKSLPALPGGLQKLKCGYNDLTQLPELPKKLAELDCSKNVLSGVLDLSGCDKLKTVNCGGNELTSIVLSGKADYEFIDVSFNNLTSERSITGQNIEWDTGSFVFYPQNYDEEIFYIFPKQSLEFDGTKDLVITYREPEGVEILDFEYIEFCADINEEAAEGYDTCIRLYFEDYEKLCSYDLEKREITISKNIIKEFDLIEDVKYCMGAVSYEGENEEGRYSTEDCYGDVYFVYEKGEYTESEDAGFGVKDVYRMAGKDRFETAFETADSLKKQFGVDKFETVVLACGTNFADALAGSYLAKVKEAPILMTNENDTKTLVSYLEKNLDSNGMIYILGGNNAVSQKVEKAVKACGNVERLSGDNRYDTNLAILEEAGVGKEDVIVCTGTGFADSLSASALGKPILLVGNNLTKDQKEFLSTLNENEYFIVGGTVAVKATIEKEVAEFGKVTRISGETRYQTSVLVAETFFEKPDTAVIAYAMNFPDGLAGGPLAMSKNAPLILTSTGKEDIAAAYTKKNDITKGAVLGGSGLISDNAVKKIFGAKKIDDWK